MSFVTLDFETYYSKEFSLTKFTTEEYIRDKQFEVIGVAVKVDDDETVWFSGTHDETKAWLNQFDWQHSALLCHNTLFDGAILAWVFDLRHALHGAGDTWRRCRWLPRCTRQTIQLGGERDGGSQCTG
jgi:hypothetical protein